jgi:branched-chain amino acid transport system permease protein
MLAVRRGPLAVAVILAAIVAVLPAFLPGFAIFQLTYVAAYAIAILGLVVLTGMSGQISLGHGAFIAAGGYITALLVHSGGAGAVLALPLAALGCGIAGFAIGFVALRLEGIYLALATFALAVAVPSTLKHFKAWTGGVQGISLPPAPERPLYYLAWALAGGLAIFTAFVLRGRVGRALRGLRDQPIAAVSFGVNPAAFKTLAFGWSAAYAGIAGSLLALATAYVSPDSYGFALSLTLLAGAVLGGLGTVYGAFAGALVIEFLPLWAQRIGPAAPSVVYGLALILVMVFLPVGIAGALTRLQRSDTHAPSQPA